MFALGFCFENNSKKTKKHDRFIKIPLLSDHPNFVKNVKINNLLKRFCLRKKHHISKKNVKSRKNAPYTELSKFTEIRQIVVLTLYTASRDPSHTPTTSQIWITHRRARPTGPCCRWGAMAGTKRRRRKPLRKPGERTYSGALATMRCVERRTSPSVWGEPLLVPTAQAQEVGTQCLL